MADSCPRCRRYEAALKEIAGTGLSRPLSYGTGDDGDGWYRRIAMSFISTAAWALTADAVNPDSDSTQQHEE